ncbi:MBL fold metallo-hydrolase [Rivibacter subsaxonicus]|uniref:Glyoxylase-like metal-dependent hydrolase (Beta-lactamase superfamily II) n=1 Tax=Rivibacter subsaxonicus TaxID=457575 RepID=A0A4Q7W083_9BURK|nr:MBL fold metallo-hydrolase [Rivibacter subsaxonicus]RZU02581.1 glyoxylase-like metal-dependent hydrolase (beta-lactamase superfamily II) [Rivibacter subsaxonicus]
MTPDFIAPLSHGIFAIDTGFVRPHFDVAYLMVDAGRAAFIDTGLNSSVPNLLAALDWLGLARDAVDWVIPTHVHLDHAGGAGLLMQQLPHATLLAHPRGAPHLIDPGALVAGASAVYGADEVARIYGQIQPIASERVQTSSDGQRIRLGERELLLIDSPGHARHHHCIWDGASRGWFTGDTFGISYPECDAPGGRYIFPTSTPVQFEPEALHRSVQRMLEQAPVWMYPTHCGRIGGSEAEVKRLAALLLEQADTMAAGARELIAAPERHAALKRSVEALFSDRWHWLDPGRKQAEIAELIAIDVELNAQGLGVWLDRGARG